MARMTAKDYGKELDRISNEKEALEARIVSRAKELCKRHPDIPIAENVHDGKYIRTGEYANIKNLYVITALSLIEFIEKELANRQPYKQAKINF